MFWAATGRGVTNAAQRNRDIVTGALKRHANLAKVESLLKSIISILHFSARSLSGSFPIRSAAISTWTFFEIATWFWLMCDRGVSTASAVAFANRTPTAKILNLVGWPGNSSLRGTAETAWRSRGDGLESQR